MSVEIKVPVLGESVTSATVTRWLKQPGEKITADEPVVELETDKISVEVPASASGILGAPKVADGQDVPVGTVLAEIDTGAGAQPSSATPGPQAPREASGPLPRPTEIPAAQQHAPMPAAARLLEENGLQSADIGQGSGLDGRVTKGDVLAFLERERPLPETTHRAAPPAVQPGPKPTPTPQAKPSSTTGDAREQRVPMTRLRQTIASRLKEAQNTAAILTTFNEVDMSAAKALRADYRELFEKKYGVKLGFMSIFARAVIEALREFPAINAEIDGNDVIYRSFVNLGIAVGSSRGLVVPVLHDADQMNFAELERRIGDYGQRARDGSLKLNELSGGTFSITNGGVFGSLLSTPILNAPQSAILGMHTIQDRPIALNGQVVIRPMMYIALSYDHRLIDGREAVSFLVRIKQYVEDPRRLLLEV
ncbi:2-oxoglutarate dehydrogenase complex dihydrolipoyllysine-residue succinyltransferase [Kozakia baliensis]|uniref:Dihydrolipoyllysine-residue succinyltransferase component of 2-oxoglutarate dehydrogenase complex n=1 Tax=Kozakia baliensis TaxID=153496 RepID=A0A1D8UQ84_9PROT|nr:2-oxoglutarate dehydrogenase complex dihydrolipoyllysine-residue succinyltransferase [Kozakia baliensis]AOX15810.1 dihydrolipoamide succinyltransferase [Kozakia baliensis]GBR24226.1 2-oxoglutarate dehydrogenase E2 component [Kozakia baliensis NRIC 0488]GEL64577.1 dihydrolipoyllysine-residue succinyltransferase component of 2-oxoglutarate dehydrogenase complex [Kozakia baliensis]